MGDSALENSQLEMARYLRDPANQPPPAGVELRRLKIYEDLVYNNIEGFISGGFPVLRSLYEPLDWHELVREFIDQHRCHTPYFLEISQEFLQFLLQVHSLRDCDPPFIAELAHYEWVELALDVAEEETPQSVGTDDVLNAVPRLSPLAWSLAYQFPVHRVGPGFSPTVAAEPTYLAVYRDSSDRVQFMELNAAMARMLQLVGENEDTVAREILAVLASEMGSDLEAIVDFGRQQLEQLICQTVVYLAEAR